MSPATILLILLAHKPWADRDVSNDVREEQLRPVAEAIAEVSRDRTDAAMLLALGWHESRFALAVVRHGCEGLPARACDRHHARGFAQLHEAACVEAYDYPAGSVESIRAEARCALAKMRGYSVSCLPHNPSPLYAAFSGMALGHCAAWQGANERVLSVRRFAAELVQLDRASRTRVAREGE